MSDCTCDCHAWGCPKVSITMLPGTATAVTIPYSAGYTCGNCGTWISTLNNTGAAHSCTPRIRFGTAGGSW